MSLQFGFDTAYLPVKKEYIISLSPAKNSPGSRELKRSPWSPYLRANSRAITTLALIDVRHQYRIKNTCQVRATYELRLSVSLVGRHFFPRRRIGHNVIFDTFGLHNRRCKSHARSAVGGPFGARRQSRNQKFC